MGDEGGSGEGGPSSARAGRRRAGSPPRSHGRTPQACPPDPAMPLPPLAPARRKQLLWPLSPWQGPPRAGLSAGGGPTRRSGRRRRAAKAPRDPCSGLPRRRPPCAAPRRALRWTLNPAGLGSLLCQPPRSSASSSPLAQSPGLPSARRHDGLACGAPGSRVTRPLRPPGIARPRFFFFPYGAPPFCSRGQTPALCPCSPDRWGTLVGQRGLC